MLIVDMLLKKAMNGELELIQAAEKIRQEVSSLLNENMREQETPGTAFEALENLKKVTLLIAGAAAQRLGKKLKEEQEVLMHISNMIIQTYVLESVLVKTGKQETGVEETATTPLHDINRVFLYESVEKIRQAGQEAILGFAEGKERSLLLMGLNRFTQPRRINLKEARRRIAKIMIAEGRYV